MALNDPNMYLQLAHAAANRGMPQGAPPPQGMPPGGGTPGPSQDPKVQIVGQAMQKIIPDITPQQIMLVTQFIEQLISGMQSGGQPGGPPQAPPPQMQPQG